MLCLHCAAIFLSGKTNTVVDSKINYFTVKFSDISLYTKTQAVCARKKEIHNTLISKTFNFQNQKTPLDVNTDNSVIGLGESELW
jgi:hypothetical protein